jgi:hypothetical protein
VKITKAEYDDQVKQETGQLRRSMTEIQERARLKWEQQQQASQEKAAARQQKYYWKVHGTNKQQSEEVIIDIGALSLGKQGRSDGDGHKEEEEHKNNKKQAWVIK